MAPVMQELPLMCLTLLLLCRDPGVGAQLDQNFKLHQPQDKVLVTAGETLTLNCTISGRAELGPMRWLKGLGSGNKTVYDQTGTSLSNVTRAVVGSNTDFTIYIRNIQPEDMGTYYCVKFVRTVTGVEEVFQRGSGTEVSVQAKPSPPLVSGPEQRAMPGQSVPFTCTTGGFFPKEIGVKWFKNKDPMMAQLLFELRRQVEVQATEEKNGSTITCVVVHDAQAPVNYSAILWISNPAQGGLSKGSQMDKGANLLSSLVLLWICILLEKGLLGGLLFFLFKRMKRRAQGLLPYPAPSQSLPPRAGSQGLATASSVM
ncbi:LOW QUALITY PROTEIN: tyrosine-protein phosphatase non-receptor type substrate 1-like [Cyanocitta cristata]